MCTVGCDCAPAILSNADMEGRQMLTPINRPLKSVLQVALALAAVAVVVLWPGWREELQAESTYGHDSCGGTGSCSGNTGSIGNNACNGAYSCMDNSGEIGSNACNGNDSCMDNSGEIGSNACNGEFSCTSNSGQIGANSCYASGGVCA